MSAPPASRSGRTLSEIGGAFADLGTLLPYLIGALTVAGMAPAGVLVGFAAMLIGSGLFYAIPMAVQPMKAVGAVMLTGGLSAGEIAATGFITGAILLALAWGGWLGRLARLVPQSVTAGLQLGLGATMALAGLHYMVASPWIGFGALAVLLLVMRLYKPLAVPAALVLAVAAAWVSGAAALPASLDAGFSLPAPVLPGWDEAGRALLTGVLPQLPLTLTNAVLVTAALCAALYPDRSERASARNLALTSGIGNLLLAPLGAFPMCHGAGGVQAQYRFGARTGWAPSALGLVLLALGLLYADSAAALLALIPLAAVGALLAFAGADLALSKRLFDARPDCWFPIGLTALVTVAVNPAAGLTAGWLTELALRPAVRAARRLWGRLSG